MNIPLDVVYSMPIMDRKFFIKKHNEDVMLQNSKYENGNEGNTTTLNDAISINNYAKQEQIKHKNNNI